MFIRNKKVYLSMSNKQKQIKMEKVTIQEKRITALFNYANNLNSNSKDELLAFLIAVIPNKIVKETVEQFDIKI